MRWQSRALSRSSCPRRWPDKLLSDDRAAAQCHLSPRCLRKLAGHLAQGQAPHDRPDGRVDGRTHGHAGLSASEGCAEDQAVAISVAVSVAEPRPTKGRCRPMGACPAQEPATRGLSTERSVRRVGPEGKEGPGLCSDKPVDDNTGTLLEFLRRGPCELPKDPVLVQACTDCLIQVALSLLDRTPGRALLKARSTLGVVADIIRALRYEILLIRQMVHDLNTRSRMRRSSSGRSNRRRARQGNWKSQGRCGGEHTSHPHRLQGERTPFS